MSRETYRLVNPELLTTSQNHSTNLQAPDVADLFVLFNFRCGGRAFVGNVSTLELEPTLISEMKQAYEAEARANLSEFISRI